jgi:hypothetical protein
MHTSDEALASAPTVPRRAASDSGTVQIFVPRSVSTTAAFQGFDALVAAAAIALPGAARHAERPLEPLNLLDGALTLVRGGDAVSDAHALGRTGPRLAIEDGAVAARQVRFADPIARGGAIRMDLAGVADVRLTAQCQCRGGNAPFTDRAS